MVSKASVCRSLTWYPSGAWETNGTCRCAAARTEKDFCRGHACMRGNGFGDLLPHTELCICLPASRVCHGSQALCDSCVVAITSVLDRHPELSLDLYGITRRTAPDTSPLCTAVCGVLERHLALIATSSGFTVLPWHRVYHVLRCAWDRYSDAGPLEAVWQVGRACTHCGTIDSCYCQAILQHWLPQVVLEPAALL